MPVVHDCFTCVSQYSLVMHTPPVLQDLPLHVPFTPMYPSAAQTDEDDEFDVDPPPTSIAPHTAFAFCRRSIVWSICFWVVASFDVVFSPFARVAAIAAQYSMT